MSLSFSIRPETTLDTPIPDNRISGKYSLGSAGGAIPSSAVSSKFLIINPTGAGLVYTLPPATSIISQIDAASGDVLELHISNKGTFPAHISSSPSGGDGTAIIAYDKSSAVGATGSTPISRATPIHLEFTNVNGTTGAYSIY